MDLGPTTLATVEATLGPAAFPQQIKTVDNMGVLIVWDLESVVKHMCVFFVSRYCIAGSDSVLLV